MAWVGKCSLKGKCFWIIKINGGVFYQSMTLGSFMMQLVDLRQKGSDAAMDDPFITISQNLFIQDFI